VSWWRRFLGLDLPEMVATFDTENAGGVKFDTGYPADFDPAVFGLESWANTTAPAAPVTRKQAFQVPAVKRSHDLIAGVLGGLPVVQFGPDKRPVVNTFLDQPERNVPASVTYTRTFADMYFDKVAWWQVTERYWSPSGRGWPMWGRRLAPHRVRVDKERNVVYVDGKEADQDDLIRFDSPTEGMLTAGARAIRTALALDSYAANAAEGIPPMDWFEPIDDVDPFADDDDEDDPDVDPEEANEARITRFLTRWATHRRARTTGWVPYGVKYNVGGFDPKALQMAEQRAQANLQIALVAGVDPEELGVSTTSRVYTNQFDRRKNYTDFTLGQYRLAFQGRLNMPDVTPAGHRTRLDLESEFLRSDPKTMFETIKLGLEIGAIGEDEVRPMLDKPPLDKPRALPAAPPRLVREEDTA